MREEKGWRVPLRTHRARRGCAHWCAACGAHTSLPLSLTSSPPYLDDTDDVSSRGKRSLRHQEWYGQTHKHASPASLSTRLTGGTVSHEGSPTSRLSIRSMCAPPPTHRRHVYACTSEGERAATTKTGAWRRRASQKTEGPTTPYQQADAGASVLHRPFPQDYRGDDAERTIGLDVCPTTVMGSNTSVAPLSLRQGPKLPRPVPNASTVPGTVIPDVVRCRCS